jgi:hypothetical protein
MISGSNYWQETVLSRDFGDLIAKILETSALNKAKADRVISIIGKEKKPIGTPCLQHRIKPASSSHYPEISFAGTERIGGGTRRIGPGPALTPFPDIPVNVV